MGVNGHTSAKIQAIYPPAHILIGSALLFWLAYYLDVSWFRPWIRQHEDNVRVIVSSLWYAIFNLLFVVGPVKFIFDNGGSLRELAVWPSDVGDFGYQMIMAWVFLSRLVKVAPTSTSDVAERRRAFVQIAWNSSTLWKWFFVYCWVQQTTANRARQVVAYPVSCLFFTLFHVGTQDAEYLKRAWFANTFLALPFAFFGLFAIWPLAAGAAGAVGTYTSQRFFTLGDVAAQLAGLAIALTIGWCL
mmetsp:Transcript_80837/g.127724  ORF Transcript_80837/g.127724 Transcript_80837/m.127724 type:complete len:245 (-) Transcript_80837:50-784(-)